MRTYLFLIYWNKVQTYDAQSNLMLTYRMMYLISKLMVGWEILLLLRCCFIDVAPPHHFYKDIRIKSYVEKSN